MDLTRGDGSSEDELVERLVARMTLWIAAHLPPERRRRVSPGALARAVLSNLSGSGEIFEQGDVRSVLDRMFRATGKSLADLDEGSGGAVPSETGDQRLFHVVTALDALSEDQRRVLILRTIEERSVEETAVRMDRSPNAVRILLARAMKALAERLDAAE